MKKLLVLMALILPLMMVSCGDDEPTLEKELVGEWVEITTSELDEIDIFHFIFRADHSGKFWVTTEGITHEAKDIAWSLDGSEMTVTDDDGERATATITIKNDVLTVTDEDGSMQFSKVK